MIKLLIIYWDVVLCAFHISGRVFVLLFDSFLFLPATEYETSLTLRPAGHLPPPPSGCRHVSPVGLHLSSPFKMSADRFGTDLLWFTLQRWPSHECRNETKWCSAAGSWNTESEAQRNIRLLSKTKNILPVVLLWIYIYSRYMHVLYNKS